MLRTNESKRNLTWGKASFCPVHFGCDEQRNYSLIKTYTNECQGRFRYDLTGLRLLT